MRVFAVFLGLAVLSGCYARSVPQDEMKNSWEVTVEKFNDYLTDLNSKADSMVKGIKSSQINRELDSLIYDSMSELTQYREDLKTKLGPFTLEAAGSLGRDLQRTFGKLDWHLLEAREQMKKYRLELTTMMEQNTDDVRVRVSAYSRKLKKRLNKDTQSIKRTVEELFGNLHSSTSNNMEGMKERFDPFFAQVRDNVQAKISTLGDLFHDTTEDMKDCIETTAEDLRSTLQDKFEELKNWFQPSM
ncbi:apolipoprotein Ea [Pseudochaenichthys georgianus]|uniref:apolipoprotein Ea n=1 Tax=Pseudochaenichthys georgianus TaxID=52239 RepID=UPI00146C0365|nr:apolipoprotein Ea [Pseudochaenichthys georgianus]